VKKLVIAAAVAIIVAAAVVFMALAPRTPAGQPPLKTVNAANLSQLREAFNASSASPRVVGLFSTG